MQRILNLLSHEGTAARIDALDAITRLLHEPKPLSPEKKLLLKVMLKRLSLSDPQDEAESCCKEV